MLNSRPYAAQHLQASLQGCRGLGGLWLLGVNFHSGMLGFNSATPVSVNGKYKACTNPCIAFQIYIPGWENEA